MTIDINYINRVELILTNSIIIVIYDINNIEDIYMFIVQINDEYINLPNEHNWEFNISLIIRNIINTEQFINNNI